MVELSLFRRFVPMHFLPPHERAELARHCQVSRFEPGQSPFRRGVISAAAAFLVEGEVELEDERGTRHIAAGTDEARHALSNADRFSASVRCITPSTLLFVNRDKLDFVMTWAQSGTIEVREIGEGDNHDWMGTMLQCPAIQQIPPANIARVLTSVEPLQVPADAVIIEQDTPGDSYYVLTAGRCSVWRRESPGAAARRIGRLEPGSGFGEEALLSGEPRNATVRADEDCRMVRLGAADFATLMQSPMLRKATLDSAPAKAVFVDVRLPEEFTHGHLPGAINLPLWELRERCGELDRSRPLVVYCDGGQRSAAATFLLCERGFDSSWVPGGIEPEHLTARG